MEGKKLLDEKLNENKKEMDKFGDEIVEINLIKDERILVLESKVLKLERELEEMTQKNDKLEEELMKAQIE